MMRLSKKNLDNISSGNVSIPDTRMLALPEKILQFGTGVLLRGLCDYFVHDANTRGIFNGRIVVVKSTDSGTTDDFSEQDNLYTICVRGLDKNELVEENIICSSISRVLSAKSEWSEILKTMRSRDLKIIISNTTEVGLQLVNEKVLNNVPSSFPGKLLAVLHERYTHLKDESLIVIPTELLSDNGEKLRGIIDELVVYNQFDNDFKSWLNDKVTFCNSLVDRIVTKDPGEELLADIQTQLGYSDTLLTMCEDYRLWAIEGDEEVKKILSFTATRQGAFVKPDIDIFKFLKLHLLNGTHTLSASLAFLAGFDIVKQGMEHPIFSSYVERLMKSDIANAIPYDIPQSEIDSFSAKVLDRFRNPFLQHKWINITLQNTMKMRNRNIPVLLNYEKLHGTSPEYMATGFAGYLLFMKPGHHPINDDQAAYFAGIWQSESTPEKVVNAVLSNASLWGTDLSRYKPFADSVSNKLTSMLTNGVLDTIKNI